MPIVVIRLIRLILGIIIIGFWIDTIFTSDRIFLALPFLVLIFLFSSKKIQQRYYRIETRFLENLNKREHEEKEAKNQVVEEVSHQEAGTLLWGAHMVKLQVDPLATYVGRHLKELQWREKYGINIAYIKRGDFIIYAPMRDNRLLPFDEVGVIATDEQLEIFEPVFNTKEEVVHSVTEPDDVILYKLKIYPENILNGKTIEASDVCKKTNSFILGVERNNDKFMHPAKDFRFATDDIVWIVGERKKVLSLDK
ncbi:MAG: sodium:proton antiporter [Bacteroidetes bacterium OLB9]|nr:MAG: sodium:proton antiporter [Bacteroidetes bacterium OLB9]